MSNGISGVKSLRGAEMRSGAARHRGDDALGGEYREPRLEALQGGCELLWHAKGLWERDAGCDRLYDCRHDAPQAALHLHSARDEQVVASDGMRHLLTCRQ